MSTNNNKILIIDDDTDICFLLQKFLQSKKFEVEKAYSGKLGLDLVKKIKPSVVLCDFRLPDIEGLDMLKAIQEFDSSIKVIIITGYSDVKLAVKAIKLGAFEYVTKPLYPEEILLTINQCIASTKEVISDSKQVKNKPKAPSKKYIEGKSQNTVQMHNLIGLVAPTDMTCLLIGESGTGKEYVAHKLHLQSKRNNKPFVAVDCGALSHDIAASELFGHIKGSFTGANADKKGHFEEADGGTLFLDEVGNLSYDNQVKLLRVLQERAVSRVGESKSRKIDIRLIAATNTNLQEAVYHGDFREDLYHRLNEFKIEILPLRNKIDDIEPFAKHFISAANTNLDKQVENIAPEALEKLKSHAWPGNLRELRNVIKRAVLLEQTKELQAENLPAELGMPIAGNEKEDWVLNGTTNLKTVIEETEKRVIKSALKQSNFNKSKTAQLLGIDRKTLYNKINQYQLINLLQEEIKS